MGKDHASVANSLARLGDLYRLQGKADEAEPLFRRALAIRKTAIREISRLFRHRPQAGKDAKEITFGADRAQSPRYLVKPRSWSPSLKQF